MTELIISKGRDEALESFETVYERHVNMLYRVCFSYMKNEAETEDVMADVFVKLLRYGRRFQSVEHEKVWLLRTAINLCKDRLKHWWRRCEDINKYQNIETENSFVENETLKAVMELSDRYKAVIYLYYYEGYSSAEIAEILKKPQSTILNHLSEARKLLRGVLKNE